MILHDPDLLSSNAATIARQVVILKYSCIKIDQKNDPKKIIDFKNCCILHQKHPNSLAPFLLLTNGRSLGSAFRCLPDLIRAFPNRRYHAAEIQRTGAAYG